MKCLLIGAAVVLCIASTALAQEYQAELKSFEITPAAPPVPALKYQLLFDNYMARRPGNAAIFYFQAFLFLQYESNKATDAALEAYEKGDLQTFEQLKPQIMGGTGGLLELDLAARCDYCDWQDPLRDFGYKTLLPQLSPLRQEGQWLKARGFYQIEDGKVEDALATVRLGYEMSRKVAAAPIGVSGLVALVIAGDMDEVLARMISQPHSPNLYWALREFPEFKPILLRDMAFERLSTAGAIPELAKVIEGREITPAQWREAFAAVRDILQTSSPTTAPIQLPDPVADSSAEILKQARVQYASSHHQADADSIEPTQALGEFYFLSFVKAYDDIYKLSGLPYPLLMARAKDEEFRVWKKLQAQQPANIFLRTSPSLYKFAHWFSFTDRQIAALTTVEAIRAYAAAHECRLPAKLMDITDTPVPENPATGLPFEYKMDGDHAVLSDSKSAGPLQYTIKLRK